jgi:hypothetical protein
MKHPLLLSSINGFRPPAGHPAAVKGLQCQLGEFTQSELNSAISTALPTTALNPNSISSLAISSPILHRLPVDPSSGQVERTAQRAEARSVKPFGCPRRSHFR